ncbi:MAG: T9SS type A sorting domain-containing protein, partial [Flavobacteriales bacterium]|nr:T9SS type A sorting domain-containing protein [Flavobacteriales bacterium]
ALYPNPTNGMVQMTWDRSAHSDMSYRLLDAFGRVVDQGLAQGNELIDWTSLAAGHYTFVAGENGTSGSLQVIIL